MEKQWGPALVEEIASEIRRHRENHPDGKISAQALSNRCADLGWPIARSVLSNLESAYRETLTVPELLILAEALGVSPLLLLLPLGHAEHVEILPGRTVSTADALRWLTGEAPLPGGAEWDDLAQSTVASFQVHQQNVDRWTWSRHYAELIRTGEHDGSEQDIERHDADAARAIEHLRNLRRLMRARGLQPPALPAELAIVDDVRPPAAGHSKGFAD